VPWRDGPNSNLCLPGDAASAGLKIKGAQPKRGALELRGSMIDLGAVFWPQ
jgi:hypothetical protein